MNINVSYELNGEIIPDSGNPGETTHWKVRLAGGTINLSGSANVDVMGYDVVDESFDVSKSVPLGTEVEIPIAAGGAVRVPVKVNVVVKDIKVQGPAQTDVDSLYYTSKGSESFSVKISDAASKGDTVTVSGVEVVPTVQVGLEASVDYVVGTWEKNIAKRSIGITTMSPGLEGSMVVGRIRNDGVGNGGWAILANFSLEGDMPLYISILLVLGVIAFSVFGRISNKNTKAHFKQAFLASIGGGICFVMLFQSWIVYKGIPYSALGISSLLFNLTDVAISQAVFYFLFLLIMIMFFGAFLHGYGYDAGEGLISKSSLLFIVISVLLILGLGLIPHTKYKFAPWIAIFGGVIGRVSLSIAKGEKWGGSSGIAGSKVCPSCGKEIESESKYCVYCGKKLE